jgi:hypothetical protein
MGDEACGWDAINSLVGASRVKREFEFPVDLQPAKHNLLLWFHVWHLYVDGCFDISISRSQNHNQRDTNQHARSPVSLRPAFISLLGKVSIIGQVIDK